MLRPNNYKNRPMFHGDIQKWHVFDTRCTLAVLAVFGISRIVEYSIRYWNYSHSSTGLELEAATSVQTAACRKTEIVQSVVLIFYR